MPVQKLEPFVARYIKAFSAAGVITFSSCDGNHQNGERIVIEFEGPGSALWHGLIWNNLIRASVDLKWSCNFSVVEFSQNGKYDSYHKLNTAANMIYNARQELRRIKQDSLVDYDVNYRKHHSNEELQAMFEENVNRLFEAGISQT